MQIDRNIERPNREPDLILPETEDYYRMDLFLEESVIVFYNEGEVARVTNQVNENASMTAKEFIQYLIDGRSECNEHTRIAQEYVLTIELEKAVFEDATDNI